MYFSCVPLFVAHIAPDYNGKIAVLTMGNHVTLLNNTLTESFAQFCVCVLYLILSILATCATRIVSGLQECI